MAVSLQERADERETGFVAIVAATGIAKLLGAIVLVIRPRVGQIYLLDNPLLKESLQAEQVKPRLLVTSGRRLVSTQVST